MASRVLGQGIVLDKDGAGIDVIMSNVTICTVGNWWYLCTEITLFYSLQIFHLLKDLYSSTTLHNTWDKDFNSVCLVSFKTSAKQKTVRYMISQHHRKRSLIYFTIMAIKSFMGKGSRTIWNNI